MKLKAASSSTFQESWKKIALSRQTPQPLAFKQERRPRKQCAGGGLLPDRARPKI